MTGNDKTKYKKGNALVVVLTFTIIISIIIFISIYMLYIELNAFLYPIKQDLFYIVQNAYLSLDKEDLSYYSYNVDEQILKDKVNELLILNNDGRVSLESLNYDISSKSVDITVNIVVTPLILKDKIGNIKIKLKDNIKLKMMEVN